MKQFIGKLAILSLILGLSLSPAFAVAQAALSANINSPAAGATLTVGQAFNFEGSASGGNSLFYSYLWNFGDGTFGAGDTYTKTYTDAGSKTITLTVADHDGSQATVSRTINVVNSNPSPVTVDLKINGGNNPVTVASGASVTLSWNSSNANSCTASGAWSGSKPTSSSGESATVNANSTYTLTCTDGTNSASDSVTANLQGTGPVAPVISNIRVTDITQTTAIVRWDTDIPADSRVIYDTVSHSTLGTAPNYGYANSSSLQDDTNKVTQHAVVLSGLTKNTQYFFRVLSQS